MVSPAIFLYRSKGKYNFQAKQFLALSCSFHPPPFSYFQSCIIPPKRFQVPAKQSLFLQVFPQSRYCSEDMFWPHSYLGQNSSLVVKLWTSFQSALWDLNIPQKVLTIVGGWLEISFLHIFYLAFMQHLVLFQMVSVFFEGDLGKVSGSFYTYFSRYGCKKNFEGSLQC